MKIYQVGGAVRDQLLGRPVVERDWVVVGGDPKTLIAQGYQPVGKDFPVFLHPQTKEEYALARTERKTGQGYTGFACYAGSEVTLEQDLLRRDLSVNAMAMDDAGYLIDPYGGQDDLAQRVLRHVSPAFVEDPLRVLRVARFAATLADYSFTIADETIRLMKTIVASGELVTLTPERVWKEWQKALKSTAPQRFFQVLQACNATEVLFPKLPLTPVTLTALEWSASLQNDPVINFAVLLHDYPDILTLSERYRVPRSYREVAQLCQQNLATFLSIQPHQHEIILSLLERLDALRKKERWEQWCVACQIIQSTQVATSTLLAQPYQILMRAWQAADNVKAGDHVQKGLSGPDIKKAIRSQRLQAIAAALTGEA